MLTGPCGTPWGRGETLRPASGGRSGTASGRCGRRATSVVMVRVSEESLGRLDDLVACGLTNSRSEAAAFLIAEGIKAQAGLFEKIKEQSQVIRNAREKLSRLLDEEPGETSS